MKKLYKFEDFLETETVFNCFGISLVNGTVNKTGRVFFWISFGELFIMLISLGIDFAQNLTSKQLIYSIVQFCMMEVAAQALISSYIILYKYLPVLSEVVVSLSLHFPQDLTTQRKHNICRKLKVLNWLANICVIIYFSCIDFFDIRPLFWRLYDEFIMQEVRLKLPFEIYTPFGQENLLVYISLYLMLVWASYTIVLIMLCYDLGFAGVLALLCIQFEMLSDRIENINPRGDSASEELKRCISIHKKFMVLVEKTGQVFSFVMLHNVLASSAVICVSSFLVVVSVLAVDYLCTIIMKLWNLNKVDG